jgi:hypothetical protein
VETAEWRPANEIEHGLMAALMAGDAREYARIVLSAPLYLPVPDAEGWPELELTGPHVVAFTSLVGLSTVVGKDGLTYHEGDFPTLARFWPDPTVLLALNPGLPITATLPLNVLTGLADDDEVLVTANELGFAVAEESQAKVRQACLADLGDVSPTSPEPMGKLETALTSAAVHGDTEAFLEALLGAEVVLPTEAVVTNPNLITTPDFPWHTVSVGGLPVIMMFSSEEMLDRIAPAARPRIRMPLPRIRVPFAAVLAGWPSDEHLLCLNPGSRTELFLSGEAIESLVTTLATALTSPDLSDATPQT